MKRWLTKELLVLISLVVAFALCEAGLWLLGIEYPIFYDFDPVLGSRLRPGLQGCWLREGGGYVSINSDGLRDREHSLAKPPHTLRIAVLGDSFAEALQVNREETFWAVMERDLQACTDLGDRRVEVINFGQSGLGTSQELLALRHRVWKYSPDIVLLAFFTGNDVADNSRALKQKDCHPYHVFRDGRLVLDDSGAKEKWVQVQRRSWGEKFRRWREDNFRIFQVLEQGLDAALARWSHLRIRGQSAAASQGPEPGLLDAVFRPPTQPVWREAWKVTEAVLLEMRDEVAARRAKFFVVVVSNGMQVHPDPAARKKYADWIGSQDLLYPDRRLERFCQQHGVPILLLAPAFQKYATQHQVFLHGFEGSLGDGHWNQTGHRLAGKMLARWLCEQLN